MLLTEIEVSVRSDTATKDLGLSASVQQKVLTPWRSSASDAFTGFYVKGKPDFYEPSIHPSTSTLYVQ